MLERLFYASISRMIQVHATSKWMRAASYILINVPLILACYGEERVQVELHNVLGINIKT